MNRNVELYVVQRRVGGGDGSRLPAPRKVRTEIKARCDRQPGHQNIAGNCGSRFRSLPMQLGRGHGTHARRVPQPYILADRCQVEIQLLVVIGGFALKLESTASGACRELLNTNVLPRERERAIHFAQSAWYPCIVGCAILDLDPPLRQWISDCSPERHVQVRLAACSKIRIDKSNQP